MARRQRMIGSEKRSQ